MKFMSKCCKVRLSRDWMCETPRAQWVECQTVNGTGAMLLHQSHMLSCGVALVLGKVVDWPLLVIMFHEAIPGNLQHPKLHLGAPRRGCSQGWAESPSLPQGLAGFALM